MRWILLLIICVIVTGCGEQEEIVPLPPDRKPSTSEASPEISEEDINPIVYVDSDFYQTGSFRNLPYRILFPREYDSTTKYPMLVFLHGVGERGTDNEKQLAIGASYFLKDSVRENYPAFIVYPQCPATGYWSDDQIAQNVKALTDILQKQVSVDPEKIMIGGFSMGAYGTFDIVSRFPGYFHSAFAIAGAGDTRKATSMARSRWRIFASKRDNVVPSAESKAIADAIGKAGASVAFKLYGEPDHGTTWVHAFKEPDLFKWLFGAG